MWLFIVLLSGAHAEHSSVYTEAQGSWFSPKDHPAKPVVAFQGAELAARSHGPCATALLKSIMDDFTLSLTMPRPTPANMKTLSLSRVISVQWLVSFPMTRPWTTWERSTRALLSPTYNNSNKLKRELLQCFKQWKPANGLFPGTWLSR